jgi:hypothetical protein
MFAASWPISGAMSLAASEYPLTLATPQATSRSPAPLPSVPVVVGTRPEAMEVAPLILALPAAPRASPPANNRSKDVTSATHPSHTSGQTGPHVRCALG